MSDVTNYNIENASGANVRIDLNAVFGAIQSNNSKGSDLADSQCVTGMWFLRSDTNTLKIRNSSDQFTTVGNINSANLGLLPRSGGTSAPMTGQFLADDSNSATAPAISFDTDTNLGLFRKGADQMGFACANAEQMIFDANGLTLQAGNNLRLADSDSSNYVALKAPATVGTNYTLTLPTATGGSGQFLKTDGSGQLSFAPVTSTQALTVNGNLTVTGTVSGSGASLTNIPSAQLTGALPALDGSALTNISSQIKQIKEVTDLSQQSTTSSSFVDALTLTLNNTSSTSRVLVISTFRIFSGTPYSDDRPANAKTTIGASGKFSGQREDLKTNPRQSSLGNQSTILLDDNSTSGNREYRIRFSKTESQTAFIENCRLIAIEFEVS
tara:strand:- start:112 stop:1263 length:1152 start_codon:yes stop_codon:yes gene_type:complete